MVYYLSFRSRELDWGPLEGSFEAVEFADPDNVNWKAKRASADPMEQGYPVKPETLPAKILWACGNEPLPDVLPRFAVSSRFRDLVEQFEPGVHQFVPVEIYKRKGGEPAATYYWFIVCQRLDSVDRDHTTYMWRLDYTGENGFWTDEDPETEQINEDAKLVFSRALIGAHHIWHDPHLLVFKNRLCSTPFGNAVIAAELTGVNVTPREEV